MRVQHTKPCHAVLRKPRLRFACSTRAYTRVPVSLCLCLRVCVSVSVSVSVPVPVPVPVSMYVSVSPAMGNRRPLRPLTEMDTSRYISPLPSPHTYTITLSSLSRIHPPYIHFTIAISPSLVSSPTPFTSLFIHRA